MQYRIDNKSGTKLSCLGFGCMRFPDKTKTEELLLKAVESGVNYFDTAYMYGGSEALLGEVLKKHNLREKVYIATKLTQMVCKTSADFDRIFAEQLKRLKTNYIDYYHMHNFTAYAQWERLVSIGIKEWIAAKKESGEIKQIGFSFHGPYLDFVKILDSYNWEFVLIQYNYMNEHYQAGVEGLRYAHAKGLPVFIMEPLLGGKLADVPTEAARVFQSARPGSTPVSWALNWLWNQNEVTVVLSGMNKMEQLEENLKLADMASAGMFSESDADTVKRVTKIVNDSFKIPCTGCNYCLPCPKGINIPSCLAAYNASYAQGYTTGVFLYLTSVGFMQQSNRYYASDCVACGVCEKKCPQNIAIIKELKRVKRRLQFPGINALSMLVNKFLK